MLSQGGSIIKPNKNFWLRWYIFYYLFIAALGHRIIYLFDKRKKAFKRAKKNIHYTVYDKQNKQWKSSKDK